jgi:hypothetical protein
MDRRAQRRFFTEVLGTAQGRALEKHSVFVSDISAKGCRISDRNSHVAVGERVVLSMADLEPLAATVRWTNNGAAGLEFDLALDTEVVLYLASFCRTVA